MGVRYRFFQGKRLDWDLGYSCQRTRVTPQLLLFTQDDVAVNDKIGRRIGRRIITAFLSVQPVYLPPPPTPAG
ncbi:uncharacterized protein G2W53_036611 [Senna tora]|uniref:Uncharacterized protein n=1 Tax=Senna tora TaxID=362788 RepID=A0A834W681_9FABA|nr:uncharacterized protein G2W53_036611 [Senna tora]